MSAAKELRDAAVKERKDWGGKENARLYPQASAIHLALAEVLDGLARDHEADWRAYDYDTEVAGQYPEPPSLPVGVLALARAINGSAS